MWGFPEVVVRWYGVPLGKGRSRSACIVISRAVVEDMMKGVIRESTWTVEFLFGDVWTDAARIIGCESVAHG